MGYDLVFWRQHEATWSAVSLNVTFYPHSGFDHRVANRIIDVLDEFACPLYDPQVDERFDGRS